MILRNVGKYLPVGIEQYAASLEPSAAVLRDAQISQIYMFLVRVRYFPVKRRCPVVKDIHFN